MVKAGGDRWLSEGSWSSGTVVSGRLAPAAFERYLPEITIRSVKPIDGSLMQHRLRGCRLTGLTFRDAQLCYTPRDPAEHGLLVLLNAGNNELELEIGNRCGCLSKGDWCVLSPLEVSRFRTSSTANLLLIEVALRFWREGEWQFLAGYHHDRSFPSDAVFAATAVALFDASQATLAATDDAALALMSALRLSSAFQKTHHERVETPRLLDQAEDVIDAEFKAPEFDATALAKKLNTSRRNLDKIFSTQGTTADKAIWEKRLCTAHCELQDPASDDASVAKIGRRNGFMNETHFTRKYKQRFGSTPSQVRTLAKFHAKSS